MWAEDKEDVKVVLEVVSSEKLPFFVLGNGTNCLFDDEGFRGVVMRLGRDFDVLEREGTSLRVGAGVNLSKTVEFCAQQGLGGFEFAVGIPGTVGGGVFTKAWTRSGGIGDRLSQVTLIGPEGRVATKDASSHSNEDGDLFPNRSIIAEASFQLLSAPEDDIRREMQRLMARRKDTQPTKERSAGCVFKNPEGNSAGRLIDECGCKGMRIGGALVSEKHANFIINTGEARSGDVLGLIERVRERVHRATGVPLALEITLIDPWGGMKRDEESEKNILQ